MVAGSARGRQLRAPEGKSTRPTSDRVREAVFDILTSMGAVDGAAVADLFAGSGALGVEALSRGAASAVFVDTSAAALDAVRTNLGVLGGDPPATVVRADAVEWARTRAGDLDLVLADPPYAWASWEALLAALGPVVGEGVVVAETGSPLGEVEGWAAVKARRYGSTVITVLHSTRRGGR